PAILLPHGAGSDAGSADGAAARCHSSLLVWWWRSRLAADAELGEKPQHHDGEEPRDAEPDRDAVEVALRDARGAEVARRAATEHVRQAASATLVQQDEQRQQEAGDSEQDLERDLHDRPENIHGLCAFLTVFGLRVGPQGRGSV